MATIYINRFMISVNPNGPAVKLMFGEDTDIVFETAVSMSLSDAKELHERLGAVLAAAETPNVQQPHGQQATPSAEKPDALAAAVYERIAALSLRDNTGDGTEPWRYVRAEISNRPGSYGVYDRTDKRFISQDELVALSVESVLAETCKAMTS